MSVILLFSPCFPIVLRWKTLKGDRLKKLTGKKLWPISPRHLASFPWPYVNVWNFQNTLWKQAVCFFYLLTNWKKHVVQKPQRERKRDHKKHNSCRFDCWNLLHIKKFSKNCWKSSIYTIKIYCHNVTQRSLGEYCKQSRYRGIGIATQQWLQYCLRFNQIWL